MQSDAEKIDKLEHEIINTKISGTKAQILALSDTLHERMNNVEKENFIHFNHIKQGIEEIKSTTKDTLAQALLTNSRVNKIELKRAVEQEQKEKEKEETGKKLDIVYKNTRVVRFMHKYPFVSVALVSFFYLFSIVEIRTAIFQTSGKLIELIVKIFT